MAVATVTQWKVTPGKQQEVMANIARARLIHERLGVRVRVWQALLAGPQAGTIAYVLEYDDLAAYARTVQQLQADSEWQAFVSEVLQATEPSATLLANSLLTDITP